MTEETIQNSEGKTGTELRPLRMVPSAAGTPLHTQARLSLMAYIAENAIAPDDPLPSEREVCESLGVSRITTKRMYDDLVRKGIVSRQQGVGTFLAKPQPESTASATERTAPADSASAKEQERQPALGSGKSNKQIIFFFPFTENAFGCPYYGRISQAAYMQCAKTGYTASVMGVYISGHLNRFMEMLDDPNTAAVISFGDLDEQSRDEVLNRKIPLVAIHSGQDELPGRLVCINPDEERGIFDAMNHLRKLGHERIAFLRGKFGQYPGDMRLAAYRRYFKENGLPFDPSWIAGDPSQFNHEEEGYVAMGTLMANCTPMPTAVLACNDTMAIGAMKHLIQHKFSVPEDVSVIGYDGIDLTMHITPSLSTIEVNRDELGRLAVEEARRMIAMPKDEHYFQKVLVHSTFRPRDSVGTPPEDHTGRPLANQALGESEAENPL